LTGYNLKSIYSDPFWSNFSKNWHWKKPTVRDFSDPIFDIFDRKVTYRDLSKNRPHKKHCAWAPTPPLRKRWNLSIFMIFWWFWGLQ
jgi:hypothetical protein